LITHNYAPQSVGLLWTSNQLVADTSNWQHTTDKHLCPGWIRTHDRSRQAAVDLRLRPRGHWDRPPAPNTKINIEWIYTSTSPICPNDVYRDNVTFPLYRLFRWGALMLRGIRLSDFNDNFAVAW
jgi:hypothetical protein